MKSRRVLYCNCVCAWQPVTVVHADGRMRSLLPPITVAELLKSHPHHFVSQPSDDAPLFHTGMLPLDMELEEGRIYLLLPLPRLLPHLSSVSSKPPSCPCFSNLDTRVVSPPSSSPRRGQDSRGPQRTNDDPPNGVDATHSAHSQRTTRWFSRRTGELLAAANSAQQLQQKTQGCFFRALIFAGKNLLPKILLRRAGHRVEKIDMITEQKRAYLGRVNSSRNRWRPGLECISEVDLLTGLLWDSSGGADDREQSNREMNSC